MAALICSFVASVFTRDQVIYLVQKLYELDELADIILVDTGAGIADTVLEFVSASNEVLVVATPEPTSITDAYALLKTLNRKSDFVKENTSIRMVANRIKDAEEGENLHQKLSVVVEKFLNIKVEYLGGILNDANCQKAVMQQDPVMLSFPNSNTIQKIAAKLIDVQLDNDDKSGIAHLFNRWMKTIYKKKKG